MRSLTVAGLQKTSLIDFPERVSCVIFLTGCNFTCPYCHNPELAKGRFPMRISLAELTAFLEKRRVLLDGVVITGGEPCLWSTLPDLCLRIRDLGLAIKLDTNGSRPDVLKPLIEANLVDFVAMDLKTAPGNYGPPLCPENTDTAIRQSIQMLLQGDIDYEFRTTCVPPFVGESLMNRMAMAIQGARRLVLQQFNPSTVLNPGFFETAPPIFSMPEMQRLQNIAAPFVTTCTIR